MKLKSLLPLAALAAASTLFAQAPPGGPGGPAPSPEMQAAIAAYRAACADDMKKLCADKQGPDMRTCMRDNDAKVSQGCKDARAKLRPPGPPTPPPAQ